MGFQHVLRPKIRYLKRPRTDHLQNKSAKDTHTRGGGVGGGGVGCSETINTTTGSRFYPCAGKLGFHTFMFYRGRPRV